MQQTANKSDKMADLKRKDWLSERYVISLKQPDCDTSFSLHVNSC